MNMLRSHQSRRHIAGSRGFTLIEVLIAVVVLSLGVLGAAGMQAASLRANREARAQEVGTRMATELAELIRANHQLARVTAAANNPYLLDFTRAVPAGTSTCFTSTACGTSLAIAQRDVVDWAQRAVALLPGIRVRVCYDTTPYGAGGAPQWACSDSGETMYVKIGWTRSDLNSSNTNLDFATVPAVVIPVTPARVS